MNIIGITSPATIENEVSLIEEMLDLGAYKFHIRKPNWTPKQLVPFLESFQKSYRKKLVLHDLKHWPFTELFGGVHLKSKQTNFALKKSVRSLSRSCHSLIEIEKFGNELDYMFLSPIFDSISKEGYKAQFNDECLRKPNLKKVYALGGVSVERLEDVYGYGFKGAAVLGALWGSKKPVAEMAKIIDTAEVLSGSI
ncbi:MAG: thiamine phosphate synthase [Fibrobacterales bacterium]